MIDQPSPSAPTRFATSTSTSSKNTSAKCAAPLMSRSGRTVMPGLFMGISKYVMPSVLRPGEPVLTNANIQSARSAIDVHTF